MRDAPPSNINRSHPLLANLAFVIAPLLLLAAAFSGGGSDGSVPSCSDRNVKVGPDQPSSIPATPLTADCNGDGTNDCGFWTYEVATVYVCDDPGTKDDHCCSSDETVWTVKYYWSCNGETCQQGAPINHQQHPTAKAVPCSGGDNVDACES